MTDTTPKPEWRSYATQIRASILHREKAAQAGATDAMVGPELNRPGFTGE